MWLVLLERNKGQGQAFVVISILILAFAVFVFVGAYLIFTQGYYVIFLSFH